MPPHHALLYETTDSTAIVASLIAACADKVEPEVCRYEVLGIDEIRNLIERAYQMPAKLPTRLFIIVATQIGGVAQSALLKLLEEPPLTTRFALVLPPLHKLLPTVYSRLYRVTASTKEVLLLTADFKEFLVASVPAKLILLAAAAKIKDNPQWSRWAADLLRYLPTSSLPAPTQGEIVRLLQYAVMTGGAKKMSWEAMAFLLPVVTELP